ncbi:MAG TPA: cupin domain-containing protein [Solirubrobacteraceae bacterium]|nr:cupin domain-containing protein [Solirubrobacteraceae bacterium]
MSNLNPTTYTEPVVQTLEQAATQAVLGGAITVRLRAEQTDGQLGLVEQVVPGGYPGPAMHVHPDFDETFYVIEGKLGFRVGDHAYEAGPGTVAFMPRGTPHTFANPGPEPARSLVLATPGGFEAYFEELIELVRRTGGLPPERELRDLGIAHGSLPA